MAENVDSSAAASWWQRKKFGSRAIGAFKTSLAAVLCLWLGRLFGLSHSYWAAISAVVVMGSESPVSLAACRDRLIGTAVGAALGWVTSHVWHDHYLVYGVAVLVCLLVCGMLEFDKAGRLASVALTIVVLIKTEGGPAQAALARFLEVSLGIVVALAVTLLVFPQRPAEYEESASHSS
ncbi:MAG TPA: FUSC family protein [Acidobacteriaceae bacterium]